MTEALEKWLELDLSAALAAGAIKPAYEIDGYLDQVAQAVKAGRNPILVGDAGVGRTAIVHELIRRLDQGDGPEELRGKKFVQLSLRKRKSALRQNDNLDDEFDKLAEFLCSNNQYVPFFSDIAWAYSFNLEPNLLTLAEKLRQPIFGRAAVADVNRLFAYLPALEEKYLIVNVTEPDMATTGTIIRKWSEDHSRAEGLQFAPAALEEAYYLPQRFLPSQCQPRKSLDLLRQVVVRAERDRPLQPSDVDACFADRHHLPRVLVDPALPLNLDEVKRSFLDRVLGQKEAVEAGIRILSLIKSRLIDERRPFGVFLFVGPTGVGKTYLAKLLAEYLFGSEDRLIRFNMADYKEMDGADLLFGNSQNQGRLAQRLEGRAFGVLLLDEFEKAHVSVHDRFLQLMDEGCFINSLGQTVSCRSLAIIATSNVGAEIYRFSPPGYLRSADPKILDRELDRRLETAFRFEFLNRFDQIVHFHPLGREEIRTIAQRELEALQGRIGLRQRGLKLEVNEAVLDWLAVHGYDPHFGARFLNRAMERHVTTALAECVVRNEVRPGTCIRLTVKGNLVVAKVPEPLPAETLMVTQPTETGETTHQLDGKGVLNAVDTFLRQARARLETLAAKKQKRSDLLMAMNESGFWNRTEESKEQVEQYRELDLAIQIEGRLAQPIERLANLRRQKDDGAEHHARLAESLESAFRAVAEWDRRTADSGPPALWLVVSNADPLHSAGTWVEDLARIELNWLRRVGIPASVMAYELIDDQLARVALEVEGGGAATVLSMEEGIHRLSRRASRDFRASIRLIPQSERSEAADVEVNTIRRRQGRFDLPICVRGQLDVASRGISMQWLGAHEETLRHLLLDLRVEFSRGTTDEFEVVRVYAEGGVGARDLRTNAVLPRMKDVRDGKLNKLLEAWKRPTA